MQALRPCFPLCLGVSSLKLVSEYHPEIVIRFDRPVPLRGGFSSIRQADGWLATGRSEVGENRFDLFVNLCVYILFGGIFLGFKVIGNLGGDTL